jgi:hypothetical protein
VVKHGLTLGALPAKLDILPLYIVLLTLFPFIYLGLRRRAAITIGISAAIWLAANIDRDLNLTNWMDGHGWYFNPYAWQFLFVIGVVGARLVNSYGGSLPSSIVLRRICWAYVLFALAASAPWASWGLWDFHPIPMATPDKSSLAFFRLIHVLALVYLALSSARFLRIARSRWLSPLDVCGRHSLEVFSFATLATLVGGLLGTTFGMGWAMQIAVNGIGIAGMVGIATALERIKRRHRRADSNACAATPDVEKNGAWPSVSSASLPSSHSSLPPPVSR